LTLSDSTGGSDTVTLDFSAPGVLDFGFASFSSVDLTDIDSIRLSNVSTTSGLNDGWRIAEISTAVPEPSTALLVALGLVGIAAGRRRTAARFH
jgi:hypothetical protein